MFCSQTKMALNSLVTKTKNRPQVILRTVFILNFKLAEKCNFTLISLPLHVQNRLLQIPIDRDLWGYRGKYSRANRDWL